MNMANDKSYSHRWIVSQEGSRQTYAVPLGFQKLRQLKTFYVDIWCRRFRSLLKRGPTGARALATRFHPDIPTDRVVSYDAMSIVSRASVQLRRSKLDDHDLSMEFLRFGSWFATKVRKDLARVDLDPVKDIFFGFNIDSLETLEHLKGRGVFTVLDQVDPGKVEEDMVIEERQRWPGWENSTTRISEFVWRRIKSEWELADLILVNSQWSKSALLRQGVLPERIIVVPLAIDLHGWKAGSPINPNGPLKVLWLGTIILRKGIQYLVEAARLLEHHDIEFLVVGPSYISPYVIKTFPKSMKLFGRVTRDQLNEIYKLGHVFVLPTVSDGFAVTQLEAMLNGLPVIATTNCGDVVTDGVDGLLVPARDGQALASAILKLDQDRVLLRQMSCKALEKIKEFDVPQNALLINEFVDMARNGKADGRDKAQEAGDCG